MNKLKYSPQPRRKHMPVCIVTSSVSCQPRPIASKVTYLCSTSITHITSVVVSFTNIAFFNYAKYTITQRCRRRNNRLGRPRPRPSRNSRPLVKSK